VLIAGVPEKDGEELNDSVLDKVLELLIDGVPEKDREELNLYDSTKECEELNVADLLNGSVAFGDWPSNSAPRKTASSNSLEDLYQRFMSKPSPLSCLGATTQKQ
jgi:hypothetical protein